MEDREAADQKSHIEQHTLAGISRLSLQMDSESILDCMLPHAIHQHGPSTQSFLIVFISRRFVSCEELGRRSKDSKQIQIRSSK
jgi:hypothetical protein